MATQVNTYLLAGMGGAGAGAGGVQVRTHGVICQNRRVEVKSGSEPDLVTPDPYPHHSASHLPHLSPSPMSRAIAPYDGWIPKTCRVDVA